MFSSELVASVDSQVDEDALYIAAEAEPAKVRSTRPRAHRCASPRLRDQSVCTFRFDQGELQLDELSDLRSTFEACDSDKSGGMDLDEWVVVLKLWGVSDDPRSVAVELIKLAKEGYGKLGGSTKAEFQALVDSVGMPWGVEDPDVEDLELSFPEFMHLMVSGVRSAALVPMLPHKSKHIELC